MNFGYSSISRRDQNVVAVIAPSEHRDIPTDNRVAISSFFPQLLFDEESLVLVDDLTPRLDI
ncbi:hypothetical protein ABH994_001657 [Bradyrhizobium yuanmingense]|uniref:hypothetical protein n=1 Tax=Bradyrhizobium yuanmingense TaxID=108015 RepID=UPI003519C811